MVPRVIAGGAAGGRLLAVGHAGAASEGRRGKAAPPVGLGWSRSALWGDPFWGEPLGGNVLGSLVSRCQIHDADRSEFNIFCLSAKKEKARRIVFTRSRHDRTPVKMLKFVAAMRRNKTCTRVRELRSHVFDMTPSFVHLYIFLHPMDADN